ncbi:hypothetical protein QYF61_000554 [Mycteria americana]|uniref:Uncharacterized protein n=1 Tax=Mycteria americana TaxID=33587 RepID=A0AAN7NPP3_MYCAM|nr:hypothetical protein QYF61_000554 [Mycteria americana]
MGNIAPIFKRVERRTLGMTFQLTCVPGKIVEDIFLEAMLRHMEDREFSSSHALAFLTPSLYKRAASLYSSQDTCPCVHCLCISFLPFSLNSSMLFSCSLPDFLHLRIESSCTLWKESLKICQLCSAPMSLRAVSQGVLLTNSLNSWSCAFLKFRVLTSLFACPISLRTANSTSAKDRKLNNPSSLSRSSSDLCSRPFTSFVALLCTRSSTSSPWRSMAEHISTLQPMEDPMLEQAKQPQFPQPLLIRLVLQTLHQLRCPSLDMLQHLKVSLVAAFQPLFPKPVALHGVVVAQVQDLALGLVEPHTIVLGPSIQPVQVPLQSLPTLKQINAPAQLGVVCKRTQGAPDPLIQTIDKDIKTELAPILSPGEHHL